MKRKINIIALMLSIFFINSCSIFESKNQDKKLDIMIGQMLMVGFRGLEVNSNSYIIEQIKKYHLGGIILFDYDVELGKPIRNIQNPQQLYHLTKALHDAADIPLFIAVDQEGGRVARLKEHHGFPPTYSAEFLGLKNDLEFTFQAGADIGQTLQSVNINLNLAPVTDVNINPSNPAIGNIGRSFSANPDSVSLHAKAFIEGLNLHNVISCIKHFPGHGSAFNDSHYGLTDISETWQEKELEPYAFLIENNYVEMIMTGHLFHQDFDPQHPATLSRNFLNNLLRNELNYDGVIISDDMNMQAITNYYGLEEAVLLALEAGVDILLYANNMEYNSEIASILHNYIKSLVNQGVVSYSRIEKSYLRIMNLKNKIN